MLYIHSLFLRTGNPWYAEAIEVLERSIKVNSPSSEFARHESALTPELRIFEKNCAAAGRPITAFVSAIKMHWQNFVVQNSPTGSLLAFLDADMMCLRDLEPISEAIGDSDIAVTMAIQGDRYAWNTGAIFVRVSKHVRDLYSEWEYQARAMALNRHFHSQYASSYGGVSQSSLAHILHNTPIGLNTRVAPILNSEWNALNITHYAPESDPRLVHIIGNLRRALMNGSRLREKDPLNKYAAIWRQFANESVTT